jgi:hypothetical protein
MSRTWLRLILLALAFALGTAALGWWAVPAVGALWGLINAAGRRVAFHAGVAAALAWAALVLVPAVLGAPVLSFAGKLAATMRVPGWVLAAVEVLFPFALAWASATLGAAVLASRARRMPSPERPLATGPHSSE